MRHFILFLSAFLLLGLWFAASAHAQQDVGSLAPTTINQTPAKEPAAPAMIANLSKSGAQVRYLGRAEGYDGWIAIHGGQVQYFYNQPGTDGIISGLLMDGSGHLITAQQIKALQAKSGGALEPLAQTDTATPKKQTLPQFKTPAEQLYDDVSNANWLALGSKNAPYIYTFIDPQCPHCHDLLTDLRHSYIEAGTLQVRIIPVGFTEDSAAQAAFLLAAPDPQDKLFKHLDGDKTALPVTPGINEQGVERNLAIMQSWKLDVTPISVYRSGSGQIKIIRGRIQDPRAVLADLAPKP